MDRFPPVPHYLMKPTTDPQDIILYWEEHIEIKRFIKDFIKDKLLNDREFFAIMATSPIQPEQDNVSTKLRSLSFCLKDYTDVTINNQTLPLNITNIKILFQFIDITYIHRNICLTYINLKGFIERLYKKLGKFYIDRKRIN